MIARDRASSVPRSPRYRAEADEPLRRRGSPRRAGARAASLEPVASVVQKLAVLLAAGVAPTSSWVYLAEQPRGPATPMLSAVASSARDGGSVSAAIVDSLGLVPEPDAPAWRGVAAAWQVATDAGAPLAPTLRDLAASLRSLAQVQRELATALAGPVATARMVMALPIIGVLFGLALGFDTVGTLFTTPVGWVCLMTGLSLMLAARVWNGKLVSQAQPPRLTPGLAVDLMAIAVSGGASIARARTAVETAIDHCGLEAAGAGAAADDVLELSRRAGVPAAGLLRSEADEQRRTAQADGNRKAATLAVTLMLPLGICVLPAFMLLGVAPLLVSVISSTVGAF